MGWPSLADRKKAAVARNAAAVEEIADALAAVAAELGGRYVIYGSAARGTMRHDSDVDILVDFPDAVAPEAPEAAERIVFAKGLVPDLRPIGLAGPRLLERALRDGRLIGEARG
jgi:predicted nucleotidyltransferase